MQEPLWQRTELLQQGGVLLSKGRKILLRELQGLVHLASPDELNEPLLLEVERQCVLLLQYLRAAGASASVDQGLGLRA